MARVGAGGVKIYQYVKQVTNLSSPAIYRALIRFHWLNNKGCCDPARRTTHHRLRAAGLRGRPGARARTDHVSRRTIAVSPDDDDQRPQRGRGSRRP